MLTSNRNADQKPILFFVPHYIGSFKYYEKLIPFLSKKYDVKFLLLFIHKGSFEEMKQYAQSKGLSYFEGVLPKRCWLDRIGFFRFAHDVYVFRNVIAEFVKLKNVSKIISVNDSGVYHRYLFDQSKKLGIECLVLQWAMSFEGSRYREKKINYFTRNLVYKTVKPIYIYYKLFIIRTILGFGFSVSKDLIGKGNSSRLGVINKHALDYFVENGIPKEKVEVVGYLDYSLAEKTKSELDAHEDKKGRLAKSLGLDIKKKQIVFFSSPYNGKDIQHISDSKQFEFTYKLMKEIRRVFHSDEAQISIKIHPSEKAGFYKGLEDLDVRIFDKHTNNYELVYFADLYVAGGTATNFVPLIMGKDVIFVNILNIKVVESTKNIFNIEEFVHTYERFHQLLIEFKNNALVKQYKNVNEITTRNSLKKIIKWID